MSKQSNQQPFLQIFGQNSEKFVKHPKELFFDYLHIFLKQKITVKKFQESFVFNLKNNNIIDNLVGVYYNENEIFLSEFFYLIYCKELKN